MPSVCIGCGSTDLVRRGKGFRNRCGECHRKYQREKYHGNRDQYLATRKALYQKHAVKRREESRLTKDQNRERYTLLEWFRRHGIPAASIPEADLTALVEMKKALKESKKLAI